MRRVRSFDVARLDTDARASFTSSFASSIRIIPIPIPSVTRRRDSIYLNLIIRLVVHSMGYTPVIVPEGAPPSVRVARASAADVAMRAPAVPATTTTRGGGGGRRRDRGRRRRKTTTGTGMGRRRCSSRDEGAFAKDCAW